LGLTWLAPVRTESTRPAALGCSNRQWNVDSGAKSDFQLLFRRKEMKAFCGKNGAGNLEHNRFSSEGWVLGTLALASPDAFH
jgi:hypothetical protein